MSWVSTPMISNDASTRAGSRYAPINCRIASVISASSSGRSAMVARRWEKLLCGVIAWRSSRF